MQPVIILIENDLDHPEWLDALWAIENEEYVNLNALKAELTNLGIPLKVTEFFTLSRFMKEFNDREAFLENMGYVWLEKNDLV